MKNISNILDRSWFKIDKTKVPDIKSAVLEACQGDDKVVFIGTDSQQHDQKLTYCTVIIVYTQGKGGRVFYTKMKTNAPVALRQKLTNEAWLSIQTAWGVEKFLPEGIDLAVHLDINSNSKWASSKHHDELYWMVKGQNFKVFTKPFAIAASHVAEHIVKGRNEAA